MKKYLPLGIAILAIAALTGFSFYHKNLRGIGPAIKPPPEDITETINTTGMPLKLPAGFSIEIFAKDLSGARVMKLDPFGNMWVSRTSKGIISQLEVGDSGKVVRQSDVFQNLRKPHGLAFDPEFEYALYIAEEHQIRRIGTYSDDPGQTILSLPRGGRHTTRTLGFGPDNKLYISIGSSCDVCRESNERRAAITQYDPKTKAETLLAKGLRNAVFFAWHPKTHSMWVTEMGRDMLGDNLPPDEINIIRGPSTSSGQNSTPNFGWPICYGKNIHDTNFDKNTYIRNPCMEPFETQSFIDIPAHSAPLGLAFIPATDAWPEEYHHDLLVAYHGSWNKAEPTGYKIVRFKLDKNGTYEGVEDFITGWLTPDGALGRPVDILIQPDGTMYISDDKAGVIYKITTISKL